jgi:hypothetical protein
MTIAHLKLRISERRSGISTRAATERKKSPLLPRRSLAQTGCEMPLPAPWRISAQATGDPLCTSSVLKRLVGFVVVSSEVLFERQRRAKG